MTMETTWLEIGGLTIRAPVTAGTNLLLCIQCAVYYRRLRSSSEARTRLWGGFFAWMAVATMAGSLKHGLRHELSESAFSSVLWLSSLTGALSTYCAQRATLVSYAPPRLTPPLERVARAQLGVFLAASVVLGPEILPLVVNTAVGLLPVIFAEAAAFRRGQRSGGWVACGLLVSIGTGSTYLLSLTLEPWLNHIDLAHLLMGVSFFLIARGSPPYVTTRPDYVSRDAPLRRSVDGVGGEIRESCDHVNRDERHGYEARTATGGS